MSVVPRRALSRKQRQRMSPRMRVHLPACKCLRCEARRLAKWIATLILLSIGLIVGVGVGWMIRAYLGG